MKLVSNTSPLIFLSKLQALPLLHKCFEEIYIPQAVQHELGDLIVPKTIQLKAVSMAGQQFVLGAMGRLHAGELEAMALAQELQADYICLDDLPARRKAQRLGLSVIGTVGVLQLAYRSGHLPAQTFHRYLDNLTQTHGMYLSAKILLKLKQALQDAH
ncbi:DUF3368 domain-containing protein [Candidatus Venteria ishoeyi]|uniref:DUF3368 domain-containing protein n=1 Tax=Candidatus Venteria ishoeyi TaxID=1899563 RepID=A0A1H6FAL3_9GAMM|nr:DUF3368 domain-containing protein [Candidatus Venteria ishoeyi]SEH06045.1 Uncharacterised protein [Candidatus Venteria ishoeyi]